MKISKARQESIIKNIVAYFRWRAPKDTHNLERNGIRFEYKGNGVWEIWADESIAPYMKYTNENWGQFHPPLLGKKNPNESWWDEACEHAIQMFCDALKGKKKEL